MLDARPGTPGEWVMLSYRVPREPSTRRIAIWRKLKALGVGQISDGLVALPADARTREHLEWIAEEVLEAEGSASIWIARPTTLATERALAASMAEARAAEYTALTAEAAATPASVAARQSLARRLRAELRRVQRRDYFPPAEREKAVNAIESLAALEVPRTKRASS